MCAQRAFQRLQAPRVFLHGADGDADPLGHLVTAEGAGDNALLLEVVEDMLAFADTHEDEIGGGGMYSRFISRNACSKNFRPSMLLRRVLATWAVSSNAARAPAWAMELMLKGWRISRAPRSTQGARCR